MGISGLVITLSEDAAAAESALAALRADPLVELGERTEQRLPLVLETPDRHTDRAVFERIRELPGVLSVDLAYAWFGEE